MNKYKDALTYLRNSVVVTDYKQKERVNQCTEVLKELIDKTIDDTTTYETRKKVEDTCRASIASYNTDKATYEQYKDSDNDLEQSWASSAKMRANKTASVYNNYILENSYVFDGNIPSDINIQLQIID